MNLKIFKTLFDQQLVESEDCFQQEITNIIKKIQKYLLLFSHLKRDKLLFVAMPWKLEKLGTNFSQTDNTYT